MDGYLSLVVNAVDGDHGWEVGTFSKVTCVKRSAKEFSLMSSLLPRLGTYLPCVLS
jgi:hypothetical protein